FAYNSTLKFPDFHFINSNLEWLFILRFLHKNYHKLTHFHFHSCLLYLYIHHHIYHHFHYHHYFHYHHHFHHYHHFHHCHHFHYLSILQFFFLNLFRS